MAEERKVLFIKMKLKEIDSTQQAKVSLLLPFSCFIYTATNICLITLTQHFQLIILWKIKKVAARLTDDLAIVFRRIYNENFP